MTGSWLTGNRLADWIDKNPESALSFFSGQVPLYTSAQVYLAVSRARSVIEARKGRVSR